MHKKCFFCGSEDLVKDGFIRGHQRLKCKACGKRFVSNRRFSDSKLYNEYLDSNLDIIPEEKRLYKLPDVKTIITVPKALRIKASELLFR